MATLIESNPAPAGRIIQLVHAGAAVLSVWVASWTTYIHSDVQSSALIHYGTWIVSTVSPIGLLYLPYCWIAASRLRFSLRDTALQVTSGLFCKNEHSVPVKRIQHVVLSQSFLERLFGLYRVVVTTAGKRQCVLTGLSHHDAVSFKSAIMQAIEGEDSV